MTVTTHLSAVLTILASGHPVMSNFVQPSVEIRLLHDNDSCPSNGGIRDGDAAVGSASSRIGAGRHLYSSPQVIRAFDGMSRVPYIATYTSKLIAIRLRRYEAHVPCFKILLFALKYAAFDAFPEAFAAITANIHT